MTNSERGMRNPANPFLVTTFNRQGLKVGEPIDTLDDAVRTEVEDTLSISEHSATPESDFISCVQ